MPLWDVNRHNCLCWGLLAPGPSLLLGPAGGSDSSREEFYIPRDRSTAFSDCILPLARHLGEDEVSLCIDVLTFLLFKSLKTGLIILVLQKKISFAARTVKTKCTDDL